MKSRMLGFDINLYLFYKNYGVFHGCNGRSLNYLYDKNSQICVVRKKKREKLLIKTLKGDDLKN